MPPVDFAKSGERIGTGEISRYEQPRPADDCFSLSCLRAVGFGGEIFQRLGPRPGLTTGSLICRRLEQRHPHALNGLRKRGQAISDRCGQSGKRWPPPSGDPVSGRKALREICASNGVVDKVSEQEIADAKAVIGRCGIGYEPASAATLAVIHNCLRRYRSRRQCRRHAHRPLI
jgi:hypothetical protein